MKNEAVRAMIAKQYNVHKDQVTVEFIASNKKEREFKVKTLDREASVIAGAEMYETIKVTIKSEPWVDDI